MRKGLRSLLVCIGAYFLGSGLPGAVSTSPLPPDPTDAVGMRVIGAVDYALCDTSKPIPGPTGDNCTAKNSRAYSKNGDWPDTTKTFFTDGCYESGINPGQFATRQVMPGCFRVVDVADPTSPKRIAEVYVYDIVNSPAPPPPSDPFWGTTANPQHAEINVWSGCGSGLWQRAVSDKGSSVNAATPLILPIVPMGERRHLLALG